MLLPPPSLGEARAGARLALTTIILVGLACLAYALTACTPGSPDHRPAVVASVDAALAAAAAVYEAEQRACPREPPAEDACIAAVRQRWAPARAALLTAAESVRAAAGAR